MGFLPFSLSNTPPQVQLGFTLIKAWPPLFGLCGFLQSHKLPQALLVQTWLLWLCGLLQSSNGQWASPNLQVQPPLFGLSTWAFKWASSWAFQTSSRALESSWPVKALVCFDEWLWYHVELSGLHGLHQAWALQTGWSVGPCINRASPEYSMGFVLDPPFTKMAWAIWLGFSFNYKLLLLLVSFQCGILHISFSNNLQLQSWRV